MRSDSATNQQLTASPVPVYRDESDLLGTTQIPAEALYGVHTARALSAYTAPGPRLSEFGAFLQAYAHVKKACALANQSLGVLDPAVATAIVTAAEEVDDGQWNAHFPTPVLQGGGGVSTNMNLNEVLANRAEELLGGRRGSYTLVHPNDHVNKSQSTNDTYPTAVAVSTMALCDNTLTALRALVSAFEGKADEYRAVDRLGRTCLRDALPLTVADTHRAHAHAVARGAERLGTAAAALQFVPLGATAIGTGVGAPAGFGQYAVSSLADIVGRPLKPSSNYYDALAHLDPLLDIAHAVSTVAGLLAKIAADLRLLSSGPHAGINEVTLPLVSAGSSIMPGKVNPAIPELVMQTAMELSGHTHTIEMAFGAAELELNAMEPVIVASLQPAIIKLTHTTTIFTKLCIQGLRWNTEVLERNLAGSLLKKVRQSQEEGYGVAAGYPRNE